MIETSDNDIKERLSLGLATLIAARAGCEVSETNVDRDSRDITITVIAGDPVSVDVQLKSTSGLKHKNNEVLYDLPIKNYNDLRRTKVGNARILVVVDIAKSKRAWLRSDAKETVFKRCAYWVSLYNAPPVSNKARRRIKIPSSQVFTPAALRRILRDRFARIQQNHGGL